MADDADITKLPLEDRLGHKVWKARLNGYEELVKIYKKIDDESSNEFNKYLGMLKKFVIDNNAVAQEKGLEAVLAFLEAASPSISGRVAGDVIAGVVTKCLNARPKTKEKGINIILMYIEVEKQDVVQEEVLKGLENKQPKIVAACTSVLRQAISEFGGKVFSLKPIVKVLPKLFDHNDKMVREEAKTLAIEIYKWIRDILKQQLQNIKPVQMKELEEEWGKLPPTPPAPTRFTRSQQQKMTEQAPVAAVATDGDASATDGAVAVPEHEAIDPYDLIEAVEILSKLPKDFYENLENKKWQARKEALEALEKLASNPKLEGGQYGELLGALKKIISKDANVVVVALAAKCIGLLATGMRKKFTQYSSMITTPILEKFKEKKANVVAALREAIDAVFLTTTFSAMQEDILAALENKNPSVKEGTVRFLVRSFSKSTPAAMPKTFLKPICSSLLKRMDDTVGPVRDATAEALGTLLKVIGERPLNPYIEQLDKIKMDKVKECAEKAEVSAVPMGAASKPASAGTTSTDGAKKEAVPAKKPASKSSKPGGKAADSAKPASASSGPSKKPSTSTAPSAGGKAVKGGKKKGSTAVNDSAEPTEPEMSPEEVDAKAAELISEAVLNQLVHANWKERLAGIEALTELIKGMDPNTTSSQVLIRVLAKKPGWKDTNFQVLKAKFALCQYIARNIKSFSKRSAFYALDGLVDKIGDIKLKEASKETLTTFSEVISLNYISLKVSKHSGSQKNPKVLAESLNWLSDAVKGFGFKIDLKPHIAYVKEALANTNPAVRTAAISLLGTLHMYVGATLRVFFEEEKPALLQQIDAEFEKVKDEKPPAPTLGLSPSGGDTEEGGEDAGDGGGGGGEGNAAPTVNLADLVPRNDISAQITPALITELGDKNWKVRGEALQKVIEILSAAKFITPELGDLPPALKARLGDSNKNLVTITLNICTTLATAMGAQINRHLKVLGAGIFSTLADAKNTVRASGITALNAWHKEIGLTPFIEGEVIFGALSTENPNLRTEVLGWLEEKLPAEKNLPSTLVAIVAPLYSCLEDRSGDVRKKAQAVVPVMMQHVGWDTMSKQANKLKPASKSNVVTILEKARASLPEPTKAPSKAAAAAAAAKPAATKAQGDSSATSGGSGGASGTSASSSGGNASKKTKSGAKQAESKSSKKSSADVESEGPPFLRHNGKDGRFKDEKDLKVLKWNFTAPRAEFVEQLKEQMRPCLGKTLHSNLFHADFKYHLIGINTMQQCVVPPSDAPYQVEVVQSLDLILKWVTLRFFDTNTTVLIKCLELMDAVFVMLAQTDYQMLEFEASSFIPYLVQKVGDPKDAIRKMIRNLFKLLTKIYPASKLFNYVMEGLPSKNSKTRMECLEELGSLIQVFGMNVCQPTPPKALAAIAAQIGDRDNGVRNAALNAVVEAYFLVGEKTCYKYCSQLSDKDLAYLEERIKRSSKNRPSTAPIENTAKSNVSARGGSDSATNAAKKKEDKRPGKPQVARPATAPAQRQENVRREFSLDIDGIEGDDLHHVVTVPTLEANEALDDLISAPVHKPYTKNPASPHMGVFSRTNPTAAFNYVISQIASGDVTASTQALVQFEKVIRNKNHKEVSKHIDQFLNAASLQLNMILTTHIPNIESNQQPEATVLRLINCLTDTMLGVFSSPALARAVSRSSLKQLMQVLITVLSDDRLAALEDGPQILRAINVLMVKVIEMSDQTYVLGSLIKLLQDCLKLLQESAGNSLSSPKFLELVMKCLWKVVRNLPKTISEVKVDQILLDIHTFLLTHPDQMWKNRADDTPLRTIKTILYTLGKLKKQEILDCLGLIDDPDSSEVAAYLKKILKSSGRKGTENHVNGSDSTTPRKSSVPDLLMGVDGGNKAQNKEKINDKLAEIFAKIGSKENTREGLAELYDFKQKYPEADIDPFLKRTSEFFQSYIERGLRNIEMERKGRKVAGTAPPSGISTTALTSSNLTEEESTDDADAYRDRLKVLRMRAGLDNQSNTTSKRAESGDQRVSEYEEPSTDERLLSAADKKPSYINIPSIISQSTDTADSMTADPDSILDIKKRLERIKNNSRN
ncbi:cytoskeleton-associated protein 5-like [Stylophora pistillata]|uniref:cytoskeleton-associated protein 5-like n=1 Tax=Stylophora pistillata TaxID=50429 RepID=UPI000C055185|nr:cytoskeleton-associated protein 5-like [Stylophora pistillata]